MTKTEPPIAMSLIDKLYALKVPEVANHRERLAFGIAVQGCVEIVRQFMEDASTGNDEVHKANASVRTSSSANPSEISDVVRKNLLHQLNLDRSDIRELPEGATIDCNITTLRKVADYIRSIGPVSDSPYKQYTWEDIAMLVQENKALKYAGYVQDLNTSTERVQKSAKNKQPDECFEAWWKKSGLTKFKETALAGWEGAMATKRESSAVERIKAAAHEARGYLCARPANKPKANTILLRIVQGAYDKTEIEDQP